MKQRSSETGRNHGERPVGPLLIGALVVLLVYVSDEWIWPDSSASVDDGGKPLSVLIHATFACFVFISLSYFQEQVLGRLSRSRALLLMGTVCLVSTLVSEDVVEAMRYLYWVFASTIVCIFIASRLTPAVTLEIVVKWAFWTALLSIVLYLLIPDLGAMPRSDDGLRGLFDHKNVFGGVVASVVPAIMFQITYGERRSRRWAWAALGACLAGLLLSKSGAGSVVSVLAVVMWVAFPALASFVKSRALAITTAILLCVAVWFGFQYALSVVADVVGKDSTLTGRTEIWQVILTYRAPSMFGQGLGSLRETSEPMQIVQRVLRQPLRSAHSMYLQILYETGVVGLIAYVGTMVAGLSFAFSEAGAASYPLNRLLGVQAASILLYGVVESRNGYNMSLSMSLMTIVYVWRSIDRESSLRLCKQVTQSSLKTSI